MTFIINVNNNFMYMMIQNLENIKLMNIHELAWAKPFTTTLRLRATPYTHTYRMLHEYR